MPLQGVGPRQLPSHNDKRMYNMGLWSQANSLTLNNLKTKLMLFSTAQLARVHNLDCTPLDVSVNHIEIERVYSHKLLGIHFTEHLNWNKHVNSITASSYSTIAVLRKLKHMAPYHLRKKTLAESLILLKLDYGETVFYPLNASEFKRLQKCQYAAASLVLGGHVKDPKDLKTLGWLSMKDRRDFHIFQQTFKALYNKKWSEYLKLKQQTCNLDTNLHSQRI